MGMGRRICFCVVAESTGRDEGLIPVPLVASFLHAFHEIVKVLYWRSSWEFQGVPDSKTSLYRELLGCAKLSIIQLCPDPFPPAVKCLDH